MSGILHVPHTHAIHRVPSRTRADIRAAQDTILENCYSSAVEFCAHACDRAKVSERLASVASPFETGEFLDQTHADLFALVEKSEHGGNMQEDQINELCDQIQLLGAFTDPEAALESLRSKVDHVVAGFPRSAKEIERGKNPGDVLDPFLLAATAELLYAGSVPDAIEATVAHKGMMKIEDLAGHLHEEVIGQMRGNFRVPEPAGVDKEALDFSANPFPGADVAQPPKAGGRFKFFQVKSKTGTAKGGDAPRIAAQLTRLKETYDADVYFCSVIGDTLKGHRSMGGMLRADADIIIQTGETALATLTGRRIGGELMLRLYQRAFRRSARGAEYTIPEVSKSIVKEFLGKAKYAEGIQEVVLEDATVGDPTQQDSRTYTSRRKKRR